ncbi:MAG: hypothetical protein ACRDBG_11100, partial [Waterburya sp.]
ELTMENLIYLSQHLELSRPLLLEMYLEHDFNLVFLVNDEIFADKALPIKDRLLVIREAFSMFAELVEIAKDRHIPYLEVGNPYDLKHQDTWEFDTESARKFDFYCQHLGFSENGRLFLDNR